MAEVYLLSQINMLNRTGLRLKFLAKIFNKFHIKTTCKPQNHLGTYIRIYRAYCIYDTQSIHFLSILGKVTVAVLKFAVFKNTKSATGFVSGSNNDSTKMLLY